MDRSIAGEEIQKLLYSNSPNYQARDSLEWPCTFSNFSNVKVLQVHKYVGVEAEIECDCTPRLCAYEPGESTEPTQGSGYILNNRTNHKEKVKIAVKLHDLYKQKWQLEKSKLWIDFEAECDRFGYKFFCFQDLSLEDYRDEILAVSEEEILKILRFVKFEKFTTNKSCAIIRYREVLEGKKTKLKWLSDTGEQNEGHFQFNEVECCRPLLQSATYILDNLANHISIVKLPFCDTETQQRGQLRPLFTLFFNLVERTIESERSEFYFSLDGIISVDTLNLLGNNLEGISQHFPTPTKKQLSGSSMTLKYPNRRDKTTFVYLLLKKGTLDTMFQFAFVRKSL